MSKGNRSQGSKAKATRPSPDAEYQVLPIPIAKVRRRSRLGWLRLIPLLAVVTALVFIYRETSNSGVTIHITFEEGYGLEPGNPLIYRGIQAGRVTKVDLSEDFSSVEVRAQLEPSSSSLARAGSQFWIERPDISLSRVSGLETLIGAKALRVMPASNAAEQAVQYEFVGLGNPPLLAFLEEGGLDVVLRADALGNLQRGTLVRYREVVIGVITEVYLVRDASAIEARAYIAPRYVQLMREGTQFWRAEGVVVSAGVLQGVRLEFSDVQTLLAGGVNVAVPPDNAGPVVSAGHMFTLADSSEEVWETWKPHIPLETISGAVDPAEPELSPPQPKTANVSWRQRSIRRLGGATEKRLQGWVLPVTGGFLGPRDLLALPESYVEGSVQLLIDGEGITLEGTSISLIGESLVWLEVGHDFTPWTTFHPLEANSSPEDTRIYAEPHNPPHYASAERYILTEQTSWRWDMVGERAFSQAWHGAVVTDDTGNGMVGMLIVPSGRDVPWVALLPADSVPFGKADERSLAGDVEQDRAEESSPSEAASPVSEVETPASEPSAPTTSETPAAPEETSPESAEGDTSETPLSDNRAP